MKSIREACYAKSLALYLIAALVAISTFSQPAEAMFVPAGGPHGNSIIDPQPTAGRMADLAKIQAVIESKVVRQKLLDYGLSPEEALARVSTLSDKQIHELATHSDSIQAGGDPADVFFGLIIVAVLVVVLVYLLQGRVEIR